MTIEELYSIYRNCGYKVTTDSRAISGGELFFALRGENFDGNDYAAGALEKGAAYAVVNDDAAIDCDGSRLIRVQSPFESLQQLAIHHREHALDEKGKRLTVIGLTGTNGKTTTKELTSAVLRRAYNVCATEGNLNNDIGVPLSLLKIKPDTELAVIEMGANHPDDIAKLVKVSRPDCGLITNVGKAHLLGFGSFEGVKAAKGELYKWLGKVEGSRIFVNKDDGDLMEMASQQPCGKVFYGLGQDDAEVLEPSAKEPFLRIRLKSGRVVKTQLVGAYNATNVMAALCVGEHFGVKEEDAVSAIEAYLPMNQRSQMTRTATNTLIIDAYNANPSSMKAALENFSMFKSERKLALLGDMRELGEDSVKEHVRIVEMLEERSIPAILVGGEFKKALDIHPCNIVKHWAPDSEAAKACFETEKPQNTAILIKGSRGIQMEKLIQSVSD